MEGPGYIRLSLRTPATNQPAQFFILTKKSTVTEKGFWTRKYAQQISVFRSLHSQTNNRKNKPIRRTLQTHANNDAEKERGKRQVKWQCSVNLDNRLGTRGKGVKRSQRRTWNLKSQSENDLGEEEFRVRHEHEVSIRRNPVEQTFGDWSEPSPKHGDC